MPAIGQYCHFCSVCSVCFIYLSFLVGFGQGTANFMEGEVCSGGLPFNITIPEEEVLPRCLTNVASAA
jgi:hypothetical protein